jgi:hypothetical protein
MFKAMSTIFEMPSIDGDCCSFVSCCALDTIGICSRELCSYIPVKAPKLIARLFHRLVVGSIRQSRFPLKLWQWTRKRMRTTMTMMTTKRKPNHHFPSTKTASQGLGREQVARTWIRMLRNDHLGGGGGGRRPPSRRFGRGLILFVAIFPFTQRFGWPI